MKLGAKVFFWFIEELALFSVMASSTGAEKEIHRLKKGGTI